MTSLSEYYDMLSRHDYSYQYSDDQAVWRRGSEAAKKLITLQKESTDHAKLYESFRKHWWESGPKPDKPMEKTFRTGEKNEGTTKI